MAYLKKEMLTTKPTLVLLALVATVVLSVGYITALAILAPQQLAEATAAATDLVCDGCVGTTDIANSAVTSSKIGGGQVANSDLATDAVTTTKIKSLGVGNSDIATSAVTSSKISDTAGVQSVDIVNGQVTSADIKDQTITSTDISPGTIPSGSTPADNSVTSTKIADGEVKSVDIGDGEVNKQDLASGAIQLNVHIVQSEGIGFNVGEAHYDFVDCPAGEILTGGGVNANQGIRVFSTNPVDANTWQGGGFNEDNPGAGFSVYALCVDPSLP